MAIKNHLFTALKGFGMGAANVVPGVSGGTIALITGIYGKIVDSLSAFATPSTWKALFKGRFKEFWQSIDGSFLLALGLGIVVSILSLAKVVTWALGEYPVLTWAFFFGLIVASAVYMLIPVKNWKAADFLMVALGLATGLAFCLLTPTQTPQTWWFYFITGAVAICTMILPGVSGSFIMQIFGNYDIVLKALDPSAFDFGVLLPLAAGAVVGLLAFAKLLKWLLSRWERQTMLVLVGFVLGTLLKVWPWSDMAAVEAAGHGLQIPGAIVACLLGGALVVLIQKVSAKR